MSLTDENVPPTVVPDDETAADTAGMAVPFGTTVIDGVIWAVVLGSIRMVLDSATEPTGPAGVPAPPNTRLVVVGLGAACITGVGAGVEGSGAEAGATAWFRVWLNPTPPSPEVDTGAGEDRVTLGNELNTDVGRAVVEKLIGEVLRRDPLEKPEKLPLSKVAAEAGDADRLLPAKAAPATMKDPRVY
ncbi:hypothetical protein [Salinibacterium sp.]|uniref:hypothetical protein n=1 Tax=Salinibacterium sp. TaxID=1915057 RepID=UPI00286BFAD1|nr:hypothetical protein [Salinibacterium sp.]